MDRCTRRIRASCSTSGPTAPRQRTSTTSSPWPRAYDSGLPDPQFRDFAGDLANLTIADPVVNRQQKSDSDAGGWSPSRNPGWFAAQVLAVKQKYSLSVNPAERDALASMLASDPSRTVTCG